MNEQKRKNPNAGMTLLEVIIAVSIFSITAIVLLQGFVTSSRINRKFKSLSGSNDSSAEHHGGSQGKNFRGSFTGI